MSAIGPGDVVECVDARRMELFIRAGERYIVSDVCPHTAPWACAHDGCWDDGIALEGLPLHDCGNLRCELYGEKISFCVHRFRPIYKREAGAFDHMLKSKAREREDA